MSEVKNDGYQRYDWAKIKTEYITSDISLTELAEKYGISMYIMSRRSSKMGFVKARKKFKEDVVRKATKKAVTKQANRLAKELEVCDRISDVLVRALEDAEQFNRHIVTNEYLSESGDTVRMTEEKVFEKIDSRALKEIASTLKLVEEMKRSMLHIETMEQKNRELREKRKLEMEEERLQMQKAQLDMSKPDKEIKVTITGFEEGWTE